MINDLRRTGWQAREGELFRLFSENVKDYALLLMDVTGRIQSWNPGAACLLGYSEEEIIGQSADIFFVPEDRQRGVPRAEIELALATGRAEDDRWHQRKDGSRFWCSGMMTALRDEQGNLQGFAKIMRDRTDWKVTQQSLEDSQERFQQLAEHVIDVFWMADPTKQEVLYVSPAYERVWGRSCQSLYEQPRSFLDAVHPDDKPSVVGTLQRQAGGEFTSEEYRIVRPDGTLRWVFDRAFPIKDATGKVVRVAGICEDITERKLREEMLAERERLASFGRDVGLALSQNDDLAGILRRCADALVHHLNAALARIWTLNEPEQMLELQASSGLYTHIDGSHRRVPVGQYKIGLIARDKLPHLTNSVVGDPRVHDQDWARREGMVAFAGYPLMVENRVVGVMAMFAREPLSPATLDAMAVMASGIALGIERKRIEATLREQAHLLELAPVLLRDLTGRIVMWNQGAEQMYGWSKAEAIGQLTHHLLKTQFPEPVSELEHELFSQGYWHGELTHQHRHGYPITTATQWVLHRDTHGQPKAVLQVDNDITATKRAEEGVRFLAEASAALAELVDYESTLQKVARCAVPRFADWCAVDMLDPDGSLRRLSVAHVDPAKLKLAQELNQRYTLRQEIRAGAAHVARTGCSELVSEIPEELLVAAAHDEEHLQILRELGLKSYLCVPLKLRGKVLGVLTFVAAESGRRYHPVDLAVAEDVADRAAIAIENARLYGAVKEADRRKDEFLAMLAHELRNPLAPIRNALHILKSSGTTPSMAEQARDMAERQVLHLTRLVDDLLDVSRIMRGKIHLRNEVVDLKNIVDRAVETTQALFDAQGQHLTLSFPSKPVWLEADPVRLAQVIANLLNNAAKYSETGGHIWLLVEAEGDQAVLRVRDTGIGIHGEMLPRIFDLFVQADRAIHRSQGGMGIGLTLVRSLVELHHGTIQAFSDGPGKGSEFVIRLPMRTKVDVQPPRDNQPGEATRPSPRRHRVLVVDDNADAADSLAMLLRLQGQHVEVAHDGLSGLELAQQFQPDMVFLDIGMPVLNGYEVALKLRQDLQLGATLLVALTGWGQEEDKRRSRECGFDEHLVKPVEPRALESLLNHPKLQRL